jgi:hypothetical protein
MKDQNETMCSNPKKIVEFPQSRPSLLFFIDRLKRNQPSPRPERSMPGNTQNGSGLDSDPDKGDIHPKG